MYLKNKEQQKCGDFLLKSLEESSQDIKKGKVSPTFESATDALRWLKSPKKRYLIRQYSAISGKIRQDLVKYKGE